ncbi:uncharacterized protein LOC109608367 [Aethina tumida]|uniref:uncharacterized protein LOC109608367 n=1 Tax=Aethina tumida TaxID=116153 RepID=UPI002148E4E4|nr:uncharacterized protein LOC109608367 [Aethina tumida]
MNRSHYLILCIVLSGIFPSQSAQQKYLSVDSCGCNGLICSCCFTNNFPNIQAQDVCLEISANPNSLSVEARLNFNGETVLSRALDPSSVPICSPQIPGLCVAVNHVDISQRKICLKLSESVFTLAKFPCFSVQGGRLQTEKNTYD